jgi:hypothetical protein
LRDDYELANELRRKARDFDSVTAAELLEEAEKRYASIAERARLIGCPSGYGYVQARKDSDRLHEFSCKRMTPPSCGGGTLTDEEDAEEAQLTARYFTYQESPEGRGRRRIGELETARFFRARTPAEEEELHQLRTFYPDPPRDPNNLRAPIFEAIKHALAKYEGTAKD